MSDDEKSAIKIVSFGEETILLGNKTNLFQKGSTKSKLWCRP